MPWGQSHPRQLPRGAALSSPLPASGSVLTKAISAAGPRLISEPAVPGCAGSDRSPSPSPGAPHLLPLGGCCRRGDTGGFSFTLP